MGGFLGHHNSRNDILVFPFFLFVSVSISVESGSALSLQILKIQRGGGCVGDGFT